jgi:hypothetical protein
LLLYEIDISDEGGDDEVKIIESEESNTRLDTLGEEDMDMEEEEEQQQQTVQNGSSEPQADTFGDVFGDHSEQENGVNKETDVTKDGANENRSCISGTSTDVFCRCRVEGLVDSWTNHLSFLDVYFLHCITCCGQCFPSEISHYTNAS